jgi:SAM-dependent methyltransferase
MLNIFIKQKIKNNLPKIIIEGFVALRHLKTKPISSASVYIEHVYGRKGIEIGGPSDVFKRTLPLYRKIRELDGVNFSNETVWEGKISSGLNFNFIGNRKGIQFISDAIDLSPVQDETYDFVLSSNCLEHIANPLKALIEWKRVIKPNGSLILVLPNKASNFDHNRPTTPFSHLVEDFNHNTTEHDLTHLDEILAFHDLSMDPPAGDIDSFKKRSMDNFHNRTLHHHVFDVSLMKAMLEYCGFELVHETETHNDFFTLSKKRF